MKLQVLTGRSGLKFLRFINPVANEPDVVPLRGHHGKATDSWEWNGSEDIPTLSPSIRWTDGARWHYYIENGRIKLLTDSPTGSPEMIVDLPDIEEWEQPGLAIWCIYCNPSDFPGKHVVRRWVNETPGKWCYVADTIEEARRVIPRGKFKIDRQRNDDPCIVECWL